MRSTALMTNPSEALAQRAVRRLAKRHLVDFSTYMAPRWYKPVSHQLYIANYLEQVARYIMTGGKEGIGRLMIFCPPRYGKSMQVSQFFPAWLLGNMPDCRIILSSYGAELAEEDSLIVRNYVSSKSYKAIFGDNTVEEYPVTLSEERSSRGNWRLADPHRGGVKASGVGGGIVGFGAHLLNINDPFKGREEAKSETLRKKVMTWYRSEAYMRLEEGGAVIITHTRWDMEDLAGQLLQLMASDEPDADQWTVVMLPEVALKAAEYPQNDEQFKENLRRGIYIPMEDQLGRKPGEVLWPQKYPIEVVRKKHANALEFESAAQFQQMPRLETGEIFNDGDFGYVDRAPSGLQWFAYVDLALGKTETSDFNAVGPVAMDNDGVLYIRDVFKMRAIDEFLKMLKTWMLDDREQGTIWGIENHGFQSQVVKDFLADRRLASVAIGGIDIPWKDKVEGARPWAIRAKHGLVKLVRGSWNQSFIRTASGFPGVAHDDEIDTVSGGNYMVANNAVGTGRTASSEAIVVSAEELFAVSVS